MRRGLRKKDAGILAAGHGFEVGMSAAAQFEMGVVGDEVEMDSVAHELEPLDGSKAPFLMT